LLRQLDALYPHGPIATEPLITTLSESADPDLALNSLLAMVEALDRNRYDVAAFARTLEMDDDFRRRLIFVLGASEALGRHLGLHPRHWYDLADPTLTGSRPSVEDVAAKLASAVDAEKPVDALRVEYRRLLLRLAARDLAEGLLVDETAAVLADLAGGALETALRIARTNYFAAHPEAPDCRLAIIAMGKCGGRELNYVSDVDVLFVAEPLDGEPEAPALKTATQLAAAAMRICSDHTGEGTLWPVDAALRPEGKSGPLVRTLESHLAYYQRWAKTWEFRRCSRHDRSPVTPTSATSTSSGSASWSGPRPTARASSVTSKPCVVASSTTSRRPTSTGSSSWVPVDCAMSSSPSSCCSSCTAAVMRRFAVGRH